MRFDSKKVFKFAGEVSGCVVMGIVFAATQTLWYRIAEPKILNAMDKNEAKRKQPIGFRGGSPNGLLSPFRRFCTFLYGEKEFCPISVGSKNCGDFLSFSSADFTNRIMERRQLAQLVERNLKWLRSSVRVRYSLSNFFVEERRNRNEKRNEADSHRRIDRRRHHCGWCWVSCMDHQNYPLFLSSESLRCR